jgi:hypothetical protein
MAIVAGFDVHRRQITFDALDTEMAELTSLVTFCELGRRRPALGVAQGGAAGRTKRHATTRHAGP